MTAEFWQDVLSRISNSKPIDLDPLIFEDRKVKIGNAIKLPAQNDPTPLSKKLFPKCDVTQSYIGLRVTSANSDHTQIAVRLAAAALEKGVIPIILTTLNESGFERFGFRVERLTGSTKKELSRQEKQLTAFWGLAIIVDVADAIHLN